MKDFPSGKILWWNRNLNTKKCIFSKFWFFFPFSCSCEMTQFFAFVTVHQNVISCLLFQVPRDICKDVPRKACHKVPVKHPKQVCIKEMTFYFKWRNKKTKEQTSWLDLFFIRQPLTHFASLVFISVLNHTLTYT